MTTQTQHSKTAPVKAVRDLRAICAGDATIAESEKASLLSHLRMAEHLAYFVAVCDPGTARTVHIPSIMREFAGKKRFAVADVEHPAPNLIDWIAERFAWAKNAPGKAHLIASLERLTGTEPEPVSDWENGMSLYTYPAKPPDLLFVCGLEDWYEDDPETAEQFTVNLHFTEGGLRRCLDKPVVFFVTEAILDRWRQNVHFMSVASVKWLDDTRLMPDDPFDLVKGEG